MSLWYGLIKKENRMNANEYIKKLIDENGNTPQFENLRHVSQNISTVCGVSILEAENIVSEHRNAILASGLTAEK